MQLRSVLILFITLFVVLVGFGIIIPILPFYSISLGATPFEIGLLMASYSLMQFIFSPLWGTLSDRYGRKPIILVGLSGFAVTFTLFGLATNLPMLFAARIAGGILSSACLPTAMAYVADVTSEEERGGGMGMLGAAMGLGLVVGPGIGGLLGAWHFGMPFFFAAGLAAVNFVFAALFLKESRKPHAISEVKYNRFKHLLSLRGFMAFIFFLVLLQSFSISTYESTFPLFARERFGYGAYDMGIIFTIMGVIGVLVQGFLIGKMIKRLGEELVIKIGMALFVLSFFLTVLAYDLWTLALFVSLSVVGQGLMRPSLASLISKDTDLEEGATMGAMQSVDSFGRILGPVMGGALFGLGMSWPYLGNGALNLLSLLAMLFLI